jgi:Flp pilus assembly protein TadG
MAPMLTFTGPRGREIRRSTTIERLGQVRRDERGFSLVTIGFSFMALFGASMLAIDVGMLMTARTQAQTAADAGALAGATALVFNSFSDHSATGPAKVSAFNTAKANLVMGEEPSVTADDVSILPDPVTGQFNRVQVTVYRTVGRQNPVSTLIARYLGIDDVDVTAVATAAAVPADAEVCVLPFTIPDKWTERNCGLATCPWSPEESFNIYATQGNRENRGAPLANPDIYVPPGSVDPPSTGYNPITDRGLRLTLKNNNDNKIAPGMYNPWAPPGGTGAAFYRENISGCNPDQVAIGNLLTPEPGNMVGPTRQGTQDLVQSDPNAYWDEGCDCVKGSAYPVSPRIRKAPLYNPVRYTENQHTGRSQTEFEVVNYLGFFIEEVNGGGEVIGRVTPITGTFTGNAGANGPIGGFAQAIMLVR